ncbi:MAG TPA: PD-(D/E)XK nuclease family protein, partial [Candidatus Lustribacter sp.]|nr:PD-(D/E)XK nuclease family protein [Candidatus Lustribacter sp.]
VPGADPARWWVQTALSDDRPLRAPDQHVRVSPSKVESFTQCRLRWLLTSTGGDGPGVGAATIGALVHDIAHEMGDADAATLVQAVHARWGRLGMTPGWVSDRKRAEALDMVGRLAAYVEQARGQGWAKVGSELPVSVQVGRAEVTGRVDRLERDPEGRLRAIDYKTGSKHFNDAAVQEHPQLATYQVAIERGAFKELGSTSAGAALVQLGKAATRANPPLSQRPLAGHDDPQWAERLVAGVAEGMGGGQFAATQGEWCKLCPVKGSCPAQPDGEGI